ncbi:MAG: helix-turn-helix transcriptional regulator, partial [Rhodobacteraceae bacterium]|nr:helix-turn-helix transcriptional regulator [Paracoccaceae bacterium]
MLTLARKKDGSVTNTLTENKKNSKSGAYHHGDLRAALVSATRDLVEEKGPDRFSVADACRAAGVSTAAPYRHFSD